MGLGVLESRAAIVHGTVQLLGDANHPGSIAGNSQLKHTPDGKILLSPQPFDDPNDPLNWPKWRRNTSFLLILLGAILAGIHGPILSPVTLELAIEFNQSINGIAQLSSYMLLVVGGFCYVFSVLTRLYGKRGLFLLALANLVAADAWAAASSSYDSLLGARIFSGIGQAMFESMSLAIITDMFFVHERGKRVALFLFCYQTGVTLGIPIGTQIATKLGGYQKCFTGLAISQAIVLVALFLFFPECAYPHTHVAALANQNQGHVISTMAEQSKPECTKETGDGVVQMMENAPAATSSDSKSSEQPTVNKAKLHSLRLYNGRMTHSSIVSIAWRTVALTFHPTILWGALASLPLSWLVGISFTMAFTLQAPPYNFTPDDVGNMFIAAWLGTVAALAIGGTVDKFVKILSKRNKDVYEPEFRLWYLIPGMIFFIIGYTGWGWGAQAFTPWVGLAFFFGLAFSGSCIINTSIISYLLDAHQLYAVESQVILIAAKNFFGFGMGYFFVDWYMMEKPKLVFGIVSGVCVGLLALAIPFYIFGKRLRTYWMTHPFLGITEVPD